MTKNDIANACKILQRYCRQHDDCNQKCICYNEGYGCILYSTPDTWDIDKINRRIEGEKV